MKKRSGKEAFHIPPDLNGQTVAAALRRWQTNLSWNEAGRLLSARRVTVNGTICLDSGRRLKTSDVVHLFEHPRTPQPTWQDIRILHLDRQVVVAVKPALMTTLRHREERHWNAKRKNLQPTMDESLPLAIAEFENRKMPRPKKMPLVNGRPVVAPQGKEKSLPRVRAVHRLDRDTSGIMVFARTPEAETHLVQQFKKHTIERRYHAIVYGQVEANTFESRLVRDRGDGLRGSTDNANEGDRAVTHVKPLETLGRYSLIECRLETGRTHQIRIHLSEDGHTLCGETTYIRHRATGKKFTDKSGAPRLALHAQHLAFDHPVSNERLCFDSPFPKDLQAFLERLRQQAST